MSTSLWGVTRAKRTGIPVARRDLTTARCVRCKQRLPFDRFGRNKRGARKYYCLDCEGERPEPYTVKFDRHLRRTYGITLADYQAMYERQHGLCAICLLPETMAIGVKGSSKPRQLAVDHDSETGRIRGLLCSPCNRAIGGLNHDADRAMRAAEYLRRT